MQINHFCLHNYLDCSIFWICCSEWVWESFPIKVSFAILSRSNDRLTGHCVNMCIRVYVGDLRRPYPTDMSDMYTCVCRRPYPPDMGDMYTCVCRRPYPTDMTDMYTCLCRRPYPPDMGDMYTCVCRRPYPTDMSDMYTCVCR